MAVTVRALGAEDWAVYRSVRLAALAHDPRLFGSDLAREEAFTEDEWRVRAAGATVARTHDATAVRRGDDGRGDDGPGDDGEVVGVVGWYWTDEPRTAELSAMWVAPAGRGKGVGVALVRAVVDQVVRGRGAALELGVLVDNDVATRLYEREGFVDVGREVGIRSGDLLRRMRYQPGGAP